MKIRRHVVHKKYAATIEAMYSESWVDVFDHVSIGYMSEIMTVISTTKCIALYYQRFRIWITTFISSCLHMWCTLVPMVSVTLHIYCGWSRLSPKASSMKVVNPIHKSEYVFQRVHGTPVMKILKTYISNKLRFQQLVTLFTTFMNVKGKKMLIKLYNC